VGSIQKTHRISNRLCQTHFILSGPSQSHIFKFILGPNLWCEAAAQDSKITTVFNGK